MKTSEPKNNSGNGLFLSGILIAVLLLLRLVPFLFPDGRMWGFNHLLFLPDIWTYFYVAAGLFIPGYCFLSGRANIDIGFNLISNIFSKKHFYLWILISCIASIAFWLLRMPTNLLGDGYTVINNIGNELPVVFKWTEPGAIRTVYYLSLLLPVEGLARGEYAYAIISTISGGITLFFMAAIAYELTEDKLSRLMTFCLLMFSGWLLLFFGYAENYPILWPFAASYIYSSILYLKGRISILFPAVIMALSVFMHLQMVFFAASFPVLLFSRGTGRQIFGKAKLLIWTALAICAGIAFFLFIGQYQSSISFQSHILPLWAGKPLSPDYSVISFAHLFDILNLYLLLIPLLPILLYYTWRDCNSIIKDPINRFLLVITISGLFFVLIIDPRLGMGRDWDLFALTGLAPLILLIRRFILSGHFKSSYPLLIMFSFLLTFPYLAVNLQKEPSISYMQSLLELDQSKGRSGVVMLRNYLGDTGDYEQAEEYNEILINRYPIYLWNKKVQAFIGQERYNEAMQLADSVYYYNPHSSNGYDLYGHVFLKLDRYDSALALFIKSSELSPYYCQAHVDVAEVSLKLKKFDLMWEQLRIAQKLHPENFNFLQAIARTFYKSGQPDSLLLYGTKLIEIYPDSSQGFLMIGLAYRALGHYDKAISIFEKYGSTLPPGKEYNDVFEVIDEMKSLLREKPLQ